MFKILIKFNTAVIKEVPIEKEVTTFGRKADNDITLDNQAVSGHHGKIVKEGNAYFVQDLQSTNGTFLNGRKVTKAQIKNKDNIRIARHILEVTTDEPESQATENAPAPEAPAASKPAEPAPATPPPAAPAAPAAMDQHELMNKGKVGEEKLPPAATIKIVAGGVGSETEVKLTEFVTYIGTSEKALIKIKGFLAPDIAAAITRRPEGYFLKAVKAGYPKVNRQPVNEQALLESGALIEVGGTNLVFYLHDKNKKKDEENKPAS